MTTEVQPELSASISRQWPS